MKPQHQNEAGTIRVAGNVAGESPAKSGQPSDSGHVIDLEQTSTTQTQKAPVPWWRRPAPWWLLAVLPFTSIAASAKIAPRLEIYTVLACSVHKPDISGQGSGHVLSNLPVFAHLHGHTGLHSLIEPNYDAGVPRLFNTSICASDPVVQASVAKLISVIAACTGVLSFLTTGYWGAYSDRHGRARVMGISVIGLLLEDLNFILVTKFPRLVPGGYWFLVVGATVNGCLGGFTTGVAAIHTYLTDTTDEHDRSRILSLNAGLLFVGVALGPTLGSLLIRATGQALSVFYASVVITSLYSFFVWFILPESITEQQMTLARATYNEDLLRVAVETEPGSTAVLLLKIRRAITFLSPLTVFMPSSLKSRNNVVNNDRRDWSLTLVALAYGCTISTMGSYQNKLQYAASKFGWSTEMIGYFLSLIGTTRAIAMILILPIVIKLFKRKTSNPTSATDPNPSEVTPLLEQLGDVPRSSSPLRGASVTSDSISFDLNLAKLALVVDVVSFLCMGVARTAGQFTTFGVLGAFGLAFNPAVQSVTLALYTQRGGTEAGRLFGALSVIQAFATQILGPTLYGFVYARTVAIFPPAVFFVTVIAVTISFILLLFVRLPDKKEGSVEEANLSGTSND